MSWTKGQLLGDAFAALAIPNWEFDLDPEDIEYALRRMDTLVASWGTAALRIRYQLSSTPDDSSIEQDSGIPQDAVMAVFTNTALAIASRFGKTPSADLKLDAKTSKTALLASCAEIVPMQFDQTLNQGAGNKPWRRSNQQFFHPDDPLTVGQDADLTP